MLDNLAEKISVAMFENFEDSLAIAGAIMANNVADFYGYSVSAGDSIRRLSKDAANKREQHLRFYIEQLKNVEPQAKPIGRPKKKNYEESSKGV